jgi:hypothetical protein
MERKEGKKLKPVFVFSIQSIVDIITNSSSELFVLKSDTKKILTQTIKGLYPEFLKEYNEPKLLSFCSDEELDEYISWIYNVYGEKESGWRGKLHIFEGFKFDEIYEEDNRWGRDADEAPNYTLKKDFIPNNRMKLLQTIDPDNNTWLLYSIDDNPNWEFQEKLMTIGERYHLG